MSGELLGKVAMISGGSRGIGLATAKAFAAAGARVAMASRDQGHVDEAVTLLSQGGGEALGVAVDLASASGVAEFVARTLARFGTVDALVNNVGSAQIASFLELTDEILLSAWTLKLLGAIRLTRALTPVMERNGGGSVVNIGGTSWKEPRPEALATATTNAGLAAFTRGVAGDLAGRGIAINLITPGKVRTERLLLQAEREARATGRSVNEVLARQELGTPTGRITEPEEVAELALYLASRRPANLTGAEIVLDGGATRAL